MKKPAITLPPALTTALTRGRATWSGMAPRERLALGIGLGVLGVFIFWGLLIAPAWRTAQKAPTELDKLELQLQQMQRLSAEAKSFRSTPGVSAAQAAEPLRLATERLNGKGTLMINGDTATLTLNGVSGDALRGWLAEARAVARARPVNVQLTRTNNGFAGIVVVSLGAGS